jgi:hypothetical protein
MVTSSPEAGITSIDDNVLHNQGEQTQAEEPAGTGAGAGTSVHASASARPHTKSSRPGGEPYISDRALAALFSKKRMGRYHMCEFGLVIDRIFHPTTSLDSEFADAMASGGGDRAVFESVSRLHSHYYILLTTV